jgi:hypothetical protein
MRSCALKNQSERAREMEDWHALWSTLNQVAPRLKPTVVPRGWGGKDVGSLICVDASMKSRFEELVAARQRAARHCYFCSTPLETRKSNKSVKSNLIGQWRCAVAQGSIVLERLCFACDQCAQLTELRQLVVDASMNSDSDSYGALVDLCEHFARVNGAAIAQGDTLACVELLQRAVSIGYAMSLLLSAMPEIRAVDPSGRVFSKRTSLERLVELAFRDDDDKAHKKTKKAIDDDQVRQASSSSSKRKKRQRK